MVNDYFWGGSEQEKVLKEKKNEQEKWFIK